jgi:hypothetical protein
VALPTLEELAELAAKRAGGDLTPEPSGPDEPRESLRAGTMEQQVQHAGARLFAAGPQGEASDVYARAFLDPRQSSAMPRSGPDRHISFTPEQVDSPACERCGGMCRPDGCAGKTTSM